MVLKEIDKGTKERVIKLLQLFDSEKLKNVITALKQSDYNGTKKIEIEIRFAARIKDERLKEKIGESVLPKLEQFHFALEIAAHEFYFEGNIQEVYGNSDYCSAMFHQHRLNHPEFNGDIDTLREYIRLALQIPQVKKKVKIKTRQHKSHKALSFQEFLKNGHELTVQDEDKPLNSFADYVGFKAKTMEQRKANKPLDFRIVFRGKYFDRINECDECSQLEFNLINGRPHTLLEIGCNWSEFPKGQYQNTTDVFNYIRKVTERFYNLKNKQVKTTSTKK